MCFAGDSAGGNLIVSTALRAASYNIRVPDGIMAAYPALLVQYTPSPARLMSMIDPLLPVGILTRCLAGKHCTSAEFTKKCTVKPAYKEPAYKEFPIMSNWFSFPIFTMELVHYTFIRSCGYEEQIFIVPMSSL